MRTREVPAAGVRGRGFSNFETDGFSRAHDLRGFFFWVPRPQKRLQQTNNQPATLSHAPARPRTHHTPPHRDPSHATVHRTSTHHSTMLQVEVRFRSSSFGDPNKLLRKRTSTSKHRRHAAITTHAPFTPPLEPHHTPPHTRRRHSRQHHPTTASQPHNGWNGNVPDGKASLSNWYVARRHEAHRGRHSYFVCGAHNARLVQSH